MNMNNRNLLSSPKKLDIFGIKENLGCSFDSSMQEILNRRIKNPPHEDEANEIKLISEIYEKVSIPSDNDDQTDNTKLTKTFTDLNKVCFLSHQKHSKQKIILNIGKLNDENLSEYMDALIESGTNLLKIPFTIYDEKNFGELKSSCLKLKEQMKVKNTNVPIMISFEYKVMRLENLMPVQFKRKEIVNFAFDLNISTKILNEEKKPFHIISNYNYMKANKLTPGDKILIDFGAGIFYVTRIFYKNGKSISIEKEPNEIEKEKNSRNIITYSASNHEENFEIDYKDLQIEENVDNTLYNSEKKFLDFIDKLYSGKNFETIENFNENEEIEYIEAITQFDCIINPNRPVQILKNLKYDKYHYISENFFTFGEKVIKEIDFEYLVLDYVNPKIYQFFSDNLKKYKKTIPIVTKIFEFDTLRHIDLISQYSSAVIISFNNLVKDLPFLDIVVMTNMLINIFKRRELAVYVHLQFFEKLKNKIKPLPSAITDLLLFIQNGVDGFNLGSETFFNPTVNFNSIIALRDYIIEFMKLLPAAIKLKLINRSEEEKKAETISEINSVTLYNSLTNSENIIIVLISDDETFLKHFLSYNLYNNIILVTNKIKILKKFILYSVSHIILVKEITTSDEEKMEKLEEDLVLLVKEDIAVKHLLKRKDSTLLYIKCLRGENFEVFDLIEEKNNSEKKNNYS